jgi:hypothetical protein
MSGECNVLLRRRVLQPRGFESHPLRKTPGEILSLSDSLEASLPDPYR